MCYYRLLLTNDDGWVVSPKARFDDGSGLDPWAYRRCIRVDDPRPIPFEVIQEGRRQDFNVTPFSPTVVSRRMAETIASIAPDDVQRLPAAVDGEEDGEWEVLNVLACPECIDRDRSIIQYHPPDDPDHPGLPRGVVKLVIDPARSRGCHIFLPKHWPIAIVVSQAIKDRLVELGATGVQYVVVSR